MGKSVISKSEKYTDNLQTACECFSFQTAFKDTYDKSMKSELLTSQGFMEFASYFCPFFCQ